jgi:hypothetical protein
LFEAANAVQPAEVVLPDVVGDARATYTDSFAFLQEYGAALACNEIGFVYVLQAGEHTATEDLEWGVEAVMDLHSEWPISAVAISKFFSRDVGPRFLAVAALLNMWESIQSPPEIHLLGLHSDIVELALIERTWPGRVRGCDTSWPFIAARDGYLVGSLRDPTAYIDLMDPRAGVDVPGDILEILLDQMDKIAGGVIWPI